MRICFVVGTLARGGAEKQLMFMLRALGELGTKADVLCLTRGESYESEIRDLGVSVKYVGSSQNRLSRLWSIVQAGRASGADIIQSSHFYTNIYAGAAGRALGIPSIGAVRSDPSYEIEGHRFTGSWQVSLPELLITNSEKARQGMLDLGVQPGKIEFVRNVVEVGIRPAEAARRKGLKILFVGRLDANKRPDRFICLASALTKQHPGLDLRFEIAGDGEMRKALEETAGNLGPDPDRLRFLGNCGDMSEVYRDADILVSTSEREGTPNVVLEAMAHAMPVVATAVGGTREILDPARAFLVEPGDEDALVNAVTRLALDVELRSRFGFAGLRYVRENHSLDRLKSHLEEIYERLLAKRPAGRRLSVDLNKKNGTVYEA